MDVGLVRNTGVQQSLSKELRSAATSAVEGLRGQSLSALLKARFETEGFQVVLSNDGEEVMEVARERRPSLVMLDRAMPKLEGLVVLGMLKADPVTHEIPVIMLTSKAQPQEIREGRKGGASEYLLKPFAPAGVVGKAKAIRGLSGNRLLLGHDRDPSLASM